MVKLNESKADKPRLVDKRSLHRSRLFRIEELDLKFSNGEERRYERINPGHDRAVIVVAMVDADTVLLVREYGAGVSDYYWSLPKGAMEAGEDAVAAANRELKEEVGFAAGKLTVLKQLALSPSYMGNRITVVLAEQLYEERLQGDEPEPLEVLHFPLRKLRELISGGDFYEAYAVAALYMVRDILEARKLDARK